MKDSFAWGLENNEDFIRKAADIGITDIACSCDVKPEIMELCKKYNINIYKVVTLTPSYWKKRYPDRPIPLQEFSSEEEKKAYSLLNGELYKEDGEMENLRLPSQTENWQVTEEQKKRIEKMGRDNPKISTCYQFGGEPEKKYIQGGLNNDVHIYDTLCFHDPEVKALIKEVIAKELTFPGVKGIAFDGIGYINYKCCNCPQSKKLFNEYCKKNNLSADQPAWNKFSLDSLVDSQNEMVDYVKSIKPDAAVMNHIWPVFLPEPLYGNRLKVDYCGQTASWYYYWDPFRISRYSKVISEEQNKYFPNVKGVAFIGYYDSLKRHGLFPYKSPERVELELRSILNGGTKMVMVGLSDLFNNPDIAAMFKKFCRINTSGNTEKP